MYTLEQQRANRELWASKLESGEYLQGTGQLRDHNNKFCCLAVAADLAGCKWTEHEDGFEADGSGGTAPPRAMEFVGLKSAGGIYPGGSLMSLNDITRLSFKEIAAVIRSAPPGLFVEP